MTSNTAAYQVTLKCYIPVLWSPCFWS